MESAVIGREREKEQLARAYASTQSEFVAVCGRRRVGKTYLIREFFEGGLTFAASGLANQGMRQQLRAFAGAFPQDYLPRLPRDWFEAFQFLARFLEAHEAARKVVLLDELPWMDTPRSDFIPSLEFFWNTWASARHDIVLVVCGSATSWMMNKLINNHGGLHNRLTNSIFLKPFTLRESKLYLESRGFALSDYEIAEAYMLLGGIPYYLKMLSPARSLAANIDELAFSSNGALRLEMGNLYTALFRHSDDYLKIVRALASKRLGLTRQELQAQTSLESGGRLTQMLENLESCGFIRKYACRTGQRRHWLYQMVDFYTLFYFAFLRDERGLDQNYWTALQNTPAFNAWIGFSFELLALLHIRQIKRSLGIGGVITEEFSWRSPEQSAQIDLIISRQDKTANVCEIKFSSGLYELDKEEEMKLRNRLQAARALPNLRAKSLQLTMITTYGLARNKYSGIAANVVTLADLMEV